MAQTLRSPRVLAALAGIILLALIFAYIALRESSAPPSAEASSFTVTPLQIAVSVKETSDFAPITESVLAKTGSTVKTFDTGRALIEGPSSHTTLIDYTSEVVLSAPQQNATQVELLAGATWSRIEKVFDRGEYHEIATPNAIASVRGTSFGVWYAGVTTTLIVTEGAVFFSKRDATGQVLEGSGVLVKAGYKAIRIGDGEIQVVPLSQADKKQPWYIYNNPQQVTDGAATPPSSGVPPQTVTPNAGTTLPPATPPAPTAPQTFIRAISLTPSQIEKGSTQILTLYGRNLGQVVRLVIGGTVVPFTLVDGETITFTAPKFAEGVYELKILAADGESAVLPNALTVVVTPPPSPNYNTGYPQ